MTVKFIRVLGVRARGPAVIAVVDGKYIVRWSPRDDWTCVCDEATYATCPHIPAVEDLLEDRVMGRQ
ncbi:hypothetical protein GR927_30275 [Mycolicibacterium sp. 3033]|nr:hypothetical protein [Mycolicibacterium aurantiacum]